MRKKGSSLIEIVISMFIIIVLISISSKLLVDYNKYVDMRKEIIHGEQIIYSVMQELKYNYSIEHLDNILASNDIKISSYDFFNKIKNTNLLELEEEENIIIKLLSKDESNNLFINILYKNEKGEIVAERSFIKYNWMEYK